MNISLLHDPFCRDVLSDVSTFLEFVEYLTTRDEELKSVVDLLDKNSFVRIPGDYSDTKTTGYADLAFLAKVRKHLLKSEQVPVQVCVGFLMEHKSWMDDGVVEQLCRYHYHLMVEKMKDNAYKGIPSVAIILYNGKVSWNPIEELLAGYPDVLRGILLPFKCIFLDVADIPDENCLSEFKPRLGAFIGALKYAREPDSHSDFLKQIVERVRTSLEETEALDLLTSMDVYLRYWISKNFKEAFNMDFVRPPYKTIHDAEVEEAVEEAIDRQAVQTALKMLFDNKPMDEIVRYSGLSEERVRSLQQTK
ncbi:Putative transposase, YhgA-like [Fibrobacter sp. UWH5]|uniref:Rpn family recombination-promoting nuclease/putative transposase n=1 Tax=Fibrobacter sp. UWH5 TaxID=1896211 RepID=UPI00090ED9C7|nr:Rpn family recombination-promoting nuclease/putative transposase [Fibrobacter sp. UWH5]SHL12770.1 Putative transposase, YhgA-like [Fibrobacter sp. UWH5]